MASVAGLMKEYFRPESQRVLLEALPKEVPIEPKKSEWKVTSDGESLLRSFEFKKDSDLRNFVNDLLQMQEEMEHHGQILIDQKTVKVKIKTKTLNRITELDVEYASQLDKIYNDSNEQFERNPESELKGYYEE